MTGDAVSEALEDWPAPDPEKIHSWDALRAYVETRFLADVLQTDIEFFIGVGPKLRSTWDRAVNLQRGLELERSTMPPSGTRLYEPGMPPRAVSLENVKQAVSLGEIFRSQMSQEIANLYGSSAHPADPVSVTVGAARSAIDVLDVLLATARRMVDADEVLRRIAPQREVSLIDDTRINEARVDLNLPPMAVKPPSPHSEEQARRIEKLPPLIKGPGYVNPLEDSARGPFNEVMPLSRLGDRVGPHSTPLGQPWGRSITDAALSDLRIEALGAGPGRENLKARTGSNIHKGTMWVLAATYTEFREWCLAHGLDPLNKYLVGFLSPGLWEHWLRGSAARPGFTYAITPGGQSREDRDRFLAFAEAREAVRWEPPGEEG